MELIKAQVCINQVAMMTEIAARGPISCGMDLQQNGFKSPSVVKMRESFCQYLETQLK